MMQPLTNRSWGLGSRPLLEFWIHWVTMSVQVFGKETNWER